MRFLISQFHIWFLQRNIKEKYIDRWTINFIQKNYFKSFLLLSNNSSTINVRRNVRQNVRQNESPEKYIYIYIFFFLRNKCKSQIKRYQELFQLNNYKSIFCVCFVRKTLCNCMCPFPCCVCVKRKTLSNYVCSSLFFCQPYPGLRNCKSVFLILKILQYRGSRQ